MLCNDIVLVGKQIRITELFFDVIGNYCLDRGSTKMSYDWALNITEKYIFINAAFFANHHVTVAISNCKPPPPPQKKKTGKAVGREVIIQWVFFRNYVKICVNLVLTTLIIHTITIYIFSLVNHCSFKICFKFSTSVLCTFVFLSSFKTRGFLYWSAGFLHNFGITLRLRSFEWILYCLHCNTQVNNKFTMFYNIYIFL